MNSILCTLETSGAGESGYASRQYAESLQEFGTIHELPRCRGWLIASEIPNSPLLDGMGCYPLFCCQDWQALRGDLDSLAEAMVSVRVVTDTFASVSAAQLNDAFPDVCYEYKQHYVTNLSRPLESIVPSHHRRNIRKATKALTVRQSQRADDVLPEWQLLYDNLARRHGINGIARFSPQSFALQMTVPGFTAFSAVDGDATCGMTLWYVCGDVAYYHLGAYSDRGYEHGASYALFWNALTHFAGEGIRYAALGAGAGPMSAESGLTRFKQGWATHTRPVFFCGRIFQPAAYAKLAAAKPAESGFFPAYRAA